MVKRNNQRSAIDAEFFQRGKAQNSGKVTEPHLRIENSKMKPKSIVQYFYVFFRSCTHIEKNFSVMLSNDYCQKKRVRKKLENKLADVCLKLVKITQYLCFPCSLYFKLIIVVFNQKKNLR